MIILSDWDRIGDGYRMVLKMSVNDSIDDLPSANRPMNPEFFAVSKEYGIPADGSVVIENGEPTLVYKDGKWENYSGDGEKSLFAKLVDRTITEVTGKDWQGVAEIGNGAFQDCSGLTSVTIPDGVTSIGKQAFSGCSALVSIVIPDSVTSIGTGAFDGCPVEDATIPANAILAIKNNNLKTVVVTSGTSIGAAAFSKCSKLTSITIPDSVTSIGDHAFSSCSGLTRITVSKGNPVYHSQDNCLIDTQNKTLISGCNTSIIPTDGSVTIIGNSAFNGCSNLTSISIPDSVTNIGDFAFSGCSGLTSIVIPDSITSIGDVAFSVCSDLHSFVLKSTTPPTLGKNVFIKTSADLQIVVPKGAIDAYKTAVNWSAYADKMVEAAE